MYVVFVVTQYPIVRGNIAQRELVHCSQFAQESTQNVKKHATSNHPLTPRLVLLNTVVDRVNPYILLLDIQNLRYARLCGFSSTTLLTIRQLSFTLFWTRMFLLKISLLNISIRGSLAARARVFRTLSARF